MDDPFSKSEWLQAVRIAPSMKDSFHTVLSSRDVMPEVEHLLTNDPALVRCFV
jgi:glycerol-1-phosphate dehydrogenase [NAD(P)+]